MVKLSYDSFGQIIPPTIILSTRYHKHLGTIENVKNISSVFNMNAKQELSFDIYKELDGHIYPRWDEVITYKYIYIPEYREYYEIDVSIDEENNVIKHITAVSACEAELGQRMIYGLEINTEIDIESDDYDPEHPTVLYDPQNEKTSLLNRVLSDKGKDYTIEHVDSTIASIQRHFSCDNKSVYDFLTGDVAQEINCLFKFDSVNRKISVYDLLQNCENENCKYRGEFTDYCPKCGSKNIKKPTFGKNTNVFISTENFAKLVSVEGDKDSVKNCFRVEAGDNVMTSTFKNVNPSGSQYIYKFSEDTYKEMPQELVDALKKYYEKYNEKAEEAKQVTENLYNYQAEYYKYKSVMMPSVELQDTTVADQVNCIMDNVNFNTVATNLSLKNIGKAADSAVNNYAKVLIDIRYDIEVVESSLSEYTEGATFLIWSGKFKITNKSAEEDTATTDTKQITITNNNYELFLNQKIQKQLDKTNLHLLNIWQYDDESSFKNQLNLYCLDSLIGTNSNGGFINAYQTAMDIIVSNGITSTTPCPAGTTVDLYNTMYLNYQNHVTWINDVKTIRQAQVNEAKKLWDEEQVKLNDIHKALDLKTNLGEKNWNIFCSYIREQQYTNSNYVSTGLDTKRLLENAQELFEKASEELYKASELQVSIKSTIGNIFNFDEFLPLKDQVDIGNWIVVRCDEQIYRLRIIQINVDYNEGNEDIQITFSNVTKLKNFMSDAQDILSKSQSMATSFSYVERQAKSAEESADTLDKWVEEGMSATAVAIMSSEKQDVVINERGILCRQFDDVIKDFLPNQAAITSNTIAITNDNWKTTKAALGTFYYQDPDTTSPTYGQILQAYGILADTIVGNLILGKELGIYNKTNTMRMNENGLLVTNNVNTFHVNPNNPKLLSISHANVDGSISELMSFNESGNLVITGEIHATNGVFNGEVYATNGTFKGRVDANSGTIGAWAINEYGQLLGAHVNDSVGRVIVLDAKEGILVSGTQGSISIYDGQIISKFANGDGTYSQLAIAGGSIAPESVVINNGSIRMNSSGLSSSVPLILSASIQSTSYITASGYINSDSTITSGNTITSGGAMLIKTVCRPSEVGNTSSYLGNSTYKWQNIYAVTSTIDDSDRNKKTDIKYMSEIQEELFNELKPVSYRFNDRKRTHYGFISQDIEDALKKIGLTSMDFAGFCKDVKKKEVLDKNGNKVISQNGEPLLEDVLDENGNPEYDYALRYSEFIALNTHMIQVQQKTIDHQQKLINDLTERINKIEQCYK